ncbi:hypothetical protein ABZV64_13905 [Streptomyces sp. NPDC004959]|uniref:hypothetical protein n=1 Tax=unclassified Streptomyces TaxID=2593676 RepID=UPI00131CD988|nr:hypothetical protein [Streptomyces sp. NRRL F-5630]
MFLFIWSTMAFLIGAAIAFDYRNLAIRAYDIMSAASPGGGVSPRFTPDHLRIIFAVVSIASAGTAIARGISLFSASTP